ncbi:MAG: ELWxxDGT repeat protein [Pirellulales bacterium]
MNWRRLSRAKQKVRAADRRLRGRFEPLEDRCLLSITPELVKDINTTEAGSWPNWLTEMGGVAYFSADSQEGLGLWRTDGTAEGTHRIANVGTGNDDFAAVGQQLYFVGHDPVHGTELWVTDGAESGTRLVRDISPGWQSSDLSALTAVGDLVFFVANDLEAGSELWRSDGTEAGTFRVRDIRPGVEGSSPEELFDYRGLAAFVADDGEHGRKAWVSDGTGGGTRMIELAEGAGSAFLYPSRSFAVLNDGLYFVDRGPFSNSIWRYDVESGAEPVLPVVSAQLVTAPDYLLVVFGDWQSGGSMSRFDGQAVVPLLEFPAFSVGGVSDFTIVGGDLYFMLDRSPGRELWRTDGTAQGTALVTTFDGGGLLFAAAARLYYLEQSNGAVKLWATNGATSDFAPVRQFARDPVPSDHRRGVALGSQLLFLADEGLTGPELWCSDGSAAGTRLIANLALQTNNSLVFGKRLQVGDSQHLQSRVGVRWRPQGQTVLPGRTIRQLAERDQRALRQVNDAREPVFCVHRPAGVGGADGTEAGTYRVHRFAAGFGADKYARLTAAGKHLLFFDSEPSTGMELWTSDGTEAGTRIVKDVRPGPLSSNDGDSGIVAADLGIVYFVADDGVSGAELWRSDGTVEGTQLVVDLVSGSRGANPSQLASWGGRVFFLAEVGAHTGLWSTNGSVEGTALIVEVNSGDGPWYPRDFTLAGDYMYLLAENSKFQPVLWRTDGTTGGTVPVRAIGLPGSNAREHGEVLAMGGELYFLGDDGISGKELWRSDGTPNGTELVADLATGPFASVILGLSVISESLFFTADSPAGRILWRTDGSQGGTVSLGVPVFWDHVAGLGRKLIISSSSGPFGYEPFSLTPPPGDTNYDGFVDLTDFGRLKATFGATGASLAADFDVNGVVDLGDFGLLKENFGRPGSASGGAWAAKTEPAVAWPSAVAPPATTSAASPAGLPRNEWIEAVAYQLAWTLLAREQLPASID